MCGCSELTSLQYTIRKIRHAVVRVYREIHRSGRSNVFYEYLIKGLSDTVKKMAASFSCASYFSVKVRCACRRVARRKMLGDQAPQFEMHHCLCGLSRMFKGVF